MTTGLLPFSLAVGDFNGDSKADLAAGNFGSNSMTVFLGNGDGTFGPAISTRTGSAPEATAIADFNGDGVPDIAVTNGHDNTVTVLLTAWTDVRTATVSGISPVGTGAHFVEASYSGDPDYVAVTSATTPLTALPAPTISALTANPTSSTLGLQVMLTANVTPDTAQNHISTGAVTFYSGGTSLGLGTITNGVATLSTSALPVGLNTLTVAYAGDTNFATSTSSALPFTVSPRTPPTGLTEPVGTTSPVQSVDIAFSLSETYSSVAVLTQGAPNLDFKLAPTTACFINGSGQFCRVNYTFTPTHPGPRYGAIVLTNSSGTVLATAYLQGTGTGPQIIYGYAPQAAYVLASGFTSATGVAVDGNGNVFVADRFANVVKEIPAVGTIRTVGRGFNNPFSLAVDGAGNIFVADVLNNAVKEIVAAGNYTTILSVGSGFADPYSVTVDGNGNIFVADSGHSAVKEILAAGGYTTVNTLGGGFTFQNPLGIAVDGNGNVFVSDNPNNNINIEEIPAAGGYTTVTTLGSGFEGPVGLAVDGAGNVYVADSGNNVIKQLVAASGYTTINTLGSGNLSAPEGVAVDGSGNVFGAYSGFGRVLKLDFADPPLLNFAPTNPGSTSSDSPRTVTIINDGNMPLTFAVPGSGTNPTITAGFNITGASTCPQLNTSASPATLLPNASCTYSISFSPRLPGSYSGNLTSTDDNLNVYGATQIVPLNGGSGGAISPPTVISISPNSGPLAGGTVVTISGSGFVGATAVNFGATAAANFTIISDTSITATSPAGVGTVDVTVTTPGGASATSPADLYTYIAPLPQTINFPQPPSAYAGTAVLLTATGGPSTSPVVFSVISGPATVTGRNGSTLTYTGAGTVVVEADQKGDANYAAAPPVQRTITATILTEPLTTTSAVVPTLVTFSSAGTLGAVTALTQGKANGEFNIAPGGDCAIGTTYAAGQTCTVDFTFTPAHPGLRYGAVSLTDASGATLANGYVYGTGNGPQVAWLPGKQTSIGAGISGPSGATVDGNGNIFISDMGNNTVEEILASDGSTRVVGNFPLPDDVAVDGSGNVFVISNRTTVSEILAVNGSVPANPTILTLYTGFLALNGMKVDANGNVFVANSFNGGADSAINELLAVNGSIPANPAVVTVVSGIGGPTGVAIDVSGNVYFSDEEGNTVWEVMAVNGVIPPNPVTRALVSGFIEPTNVAIDGAGNLFVPNFGDHTVKEIFAVNGSIPANPATLTLSTALSSPQGLAVDSAGNVFVADEGIAQLVKLDYADPPSLTFATTDVGSTSTDSPQSVTMINNGNADLIYSTPTSGTNPSITPGFIIGNSSTCPQLTASSTPATLPAGASCTDVISFTPITGGPDSGKLITTDNDLSVPGSTQIVPLNGIGIAPPVLTLTAVPNPAAFGTTVTLTVTATAAPPQTGTPTGTIQFFNNGASLGTVPLSAAGAAILPTSTLPAGTDTITCTYSGDPNFAPATCTPVAVRITAAPSTLTLTSSVNPSPALTPVTFTAHFNVNGQAAGSGNAITFSVVQPPGVAVFTFTATTDATGTANFTPAGFYPGTYSISATFTATSNYQAASAGPITEIVNLNPTSTTLTASPNPAEQNQTITFVATVTALAGTAPPNGTVTLLDGATVLATASAAFGTGAFSTATFTFSALAPGIHLLSAVYTPLAGNSGLNIAGIPFGTATGAVSFTASQSSGLSLTITPRDFSLTANPPAISIQTQHHSTMPLILTSTGGWTGPVTLTCSSLPQWVTCELPASAVILGPDATLPVNLTIDTDQLLGFLASAAPASRPWELGRIALATLLPLTLLGFARRRKALRSVLSLVSLGIFISGLTACGANRYPQHAAPGVYNIPVTATGTAVGATVPTTVTP